MNNYFKKPAACYHWCIVPLCNNTSIKTPLKAFVQVPLENARRRTWIKAAQRDPDEFFKDSIIFVCEDHFELQHSLENYIKGNSVKNQDSVTESIIQNQIDVPSYPRRSFRDLQQFSAKCSKKQVFQVTADENLVKSRSIQDGDQENYLSNESTGIFQSDFLRSTLISEKSQPPCNIALTREAPAQSPVQIIEDSNCNESDVMNVDFENIFEEGLEESNCERDGSDLVEIGPSGLFKCETEFENDYDPCEQQSETNSFSNDNIKIDIVENLLQDPDDYSDESTEAPAEGVEVLALHKQGRITVYDKIHVCFFCEKVIHKMGRHLSLIHCKEPSVAKLVALPKHSRARRDGFIRLLRAGDFQNNKSVLAKNSGKLVVARRQHKGGPAALYAPCLRCLGFFLKRNLRKHARGCKAPRGTTNSESLRYSSAFVASYANAARTARFDRDVSPGLGSDEVASVCRSDELLRQYGIFVYRTAGGVPIARVRKKMRALGSLVAEARRYRGDPDLSLSELMSPDNFDLIVRFTRSMPNPTPDTKPDRSAKELGSALQICLLILRGMEFKSDFLLEDADRTFSNRLFDRSWTRAITGSGDRGSDPDFNLNFACRTERAEAGFAGETSLETGKGGETYRAAERTDENDSNSMQTRSDGNETSSNHNHSIMHGIKLENEVSEKIENCQYSIYGDVVNEVEKSVFHWKIPRNPSKLQVVKERRKWTVDEVDAVMEYFSENVKYNIIPNKVAASHCIETAKDGVLRNRTWSDVKYFVYNRIKKNKKPGYSK